MCELFGVSSREPIRVNEFLKEFASHSVDHPNGWGLAVFYGDAVSLEKEPIPAYKSRYLKERLRHTIEVRNMMAHIRLATRGQMEYENCHPFVRRDNFGRAWTLIHNGTIFDSPVLDKYVYTQEGHTDSERILCHIIEKINEQQKKRRRALKEQERFQVLDEIVCAISPHNKLNLIIYDSELFYVHTNYRDSLYAKKMEGAVAFATVPLDAQNWEAIPFTKLQAYRDGKLTFEGTDHGNEYIYNPQDMKYIYLDCAEL